ncbi:sensor histidine kinase, partial [Zwartia sp.]|uniref:sensor histidine kinase n=1 Tax=Zwartia sp. TaxID=2978004 RepID=UPI00271D7056
DLQQQVDILRTESERSANIMAQIHKLLRVQNENLQPIQIADVLDNALLVLSPRLSANNITLKKVGRFDYFVSGEATQLELVFINLISNAISILSDQERQRHIELECSVKNNHCIVEVKDNGPGIDQAILQSIGQIYVSGREQGSGVGLWLTNLILANHRGKLEANNRQNGGASFRVTLPLLNQARTPK